MTSYMRFRGALHFNSIDFVSKGKLLEIGFPKLPRNSIAREIKLKHRSEFNFHLLILH